MRVNRFIALATGLSRRAADKLADAGEIMVNDRPIKAGREILDTDRVTLHGKPLHVPKTQTIMLNKPVGYVCSRSRQGNRTVYDLLPSKYHTLKTVGRLDKDTSGLLLLTNDGLLSQRLSHPSYAKIKYYAVELNKSLDRTHREQITSGVKLEDGVSSLQLQGNGNFWRVKIHEGRNRQIRRTFAALGYTVVKLHRTKFGDYQLGHVASGKFKLV